MQPNICCFLGHRSFIETEEMKRAVKQAVEKLILEEGVNTFLFGSKSDFDTMCLNCVTELKAKYPHVKRINVRAEYPDIDDNYLRYLMCYYDETYYPECVRGAGKASYVKRNREMVDRSRFCAIYYDALYVAAHKKSGTQLMLEYATKQKREIILFTEKQ